MPPGTFNAVVAIVGGVLLAVAAFVPSAALHYRRAGRFTVADLAALVVVPVYGLALWTYTLLPLPDPTELVCRPALVEPFRFVDDVRAAWDGSVLDLLRDPDVLQVLLNVALFVPLGVLLRVRYRRGVLWAGAAGLAVSVVIELTQLTGIWGLYDCAYRFFDVDDLVTNTAGALAGSLLAAPFARDRAAASRRPDDSSVWVPTIGRRLVAITSDLLTMLFVGAVAVVAWRVVLLDLVGRSPGQIDPVAQSWVQWGTAAAVQAVVVLGAGRTVGEAVVGVRTVARGARWVVPSRLVKLATGAGAVAALGAWDSPWATFALVAFVAATAAGAVVTRDHRGLSNTLAGLEVEVVPPTDRVSRRRR